MRIYALADPHLSLGTPGKPMDRFGPQWADHAGRIGREWRSAVRDGDLVLVPGDVSWALKLEGAIPDLAFIGALPGTKVLARGNHDYWWHSLSKVRRALPPGVYAVQNDAVRVGRVVIGGTRLWDTPGLSFDHMIDWRAPGPEDVEATAAAAPDDPAAAAEAEARENERLYAREVDRLRRSLEAMDSLATPGLLRIALTHYPPCDAAMNPTAATDLFERHGVRHVVFGHLHSVKRDLDPPPFGESRGVRYHLAACDYLDFRPVLIDEVDDDDG